MAQMSLLDEVIEAHGGRRRWTRIGQLSAEVRSGGLLMRAKGKASRFREYGLTVSTEEQHAVFDPFLRDGSRGVYDGDAVRIESQDGELVSEQDDPRAEFFGLSGLSKNLHWSDLDALYFAGYAMWNYLNAPFLFEQPGFEVSEGEPLEDDGATWRRLDVTFPPEIHAHCAEQSFYFDEAGLLRRQDYHPEVVSRFAHAAHLCDEHREFGGIVFPTKRRVVPKGPTGHPLAGPTIVAIDIDSVETS
jgi:hypothetical protein